MSSGRSFEQVTRLVARALRFTPAQLEAAFAAATENDIDAILALRSTTVAGVESWDDRAYLRWRYGLGGDGAADSDCWLLRREGRILGMVGTQRLHFVTDQEPVEAAKIMDLAVDSRFAMHGIGGWMVMTLCQRLGVVLALGYNINSRQLAERLFQRLPDRRTWSLPIDLRPYFRARISPPWLAATLAGAANTAAGVRRYLRLRPPSGINVRPVNRFDDSFTALLNASRSRGEATVVRSAATLNWRLFDNPRSMHRAWMACAGEQLVGYIAVLEPVRTRHPLRLTIVDWALHPDHDKLALRALCATVAHYAHAVAAALVAVTAYHPRAEALLRRFGFVQRHREVEFVGLAGRDQAAIRRLIEAPSWQLTSASNDRDG